MTEPNAQIKTQRQAASSNQLRPAHVKAAQRVRRDCINSVMRSATLVSSSVTLSGSMAGSRRAAARNQMSARFCPRVISKIVPKKASSKKTPARAAKPYPGLMPLSGMEMTRAHQNIKFKTTAEPAPWAASPKALVSLGTPSSLKIR